MTTDCVLHTTYHPRTTYQALVLDIRHHGGIADTECSRLLDLIAQQAHALPLPHAPCPMPHAQCPMPNAQCPMPNSPCPMPHAQCPMPNAPCPMPHAHAIPLLKPMPVPVPVRPCPRPRPRPRPRPYPMLTPTTVRVPVGGHPQVSAADRRPSRLRARALHPGCDGHALALLHLRGRAGLHP